MKTSTPIVLGVSFIALLSVGCLEKKQDASNEQASSSTAVFAQSVSSLSIAGNCNPGKAGALIYDRSADSFYACENDLWALVSIEGEKGDAGSTGAQGSAGPQGSQGPQGIPGPAGAGSAGGFVIFDGSHNVAARVIQFNTGRYNDVTAGQGILVLYSGGEILWLNTITGKFEGRPEVVYHTGANCAGTAYIRPKQDGSPDIINRVYIGKYQSGAYHTLYKITGFQTGTIQTTSRRVFNVTPGMGSCEAYDYLFDTSLSGVGPLPIVQELPANALQDLSHLAPLRVGVE